MTSAKHCFLRLHNLEALTSTASEDNTMAFGEPSLLKKGGKPLKDIRHFDSHEIHEKTFDYHKTINMRDNGLCNYFMIYNMGRMARIVLDYLKTRR